jgi:hypothetical protein
MSSNDQSGKSLALPKTFKEIAEAAIARELSVIPLVPKEKRPILKDWQKSATRDRTQIEKWATLYPAANCGAYCSYETTWILDIDDTNWFWEQWPFKQLPQTFTVRTGSGGLQFHFKHSDGSRTLHNKSLKNPAYVEGKDQPGVKAAFLDVLIQDRQGVLPGSTHPNGRTYEVLQDLPLAEISKEHLEWLNGLWEGKKTVVSKTRINPLNEEVKVEELLNSHGLKFVTHKEGDKVYFNYHSLMGKCLVRGESHAQKGERPNERQSSFVHDIKTNEIYHFCFSAGCTETIGKTKIALAAIGIELEDIVAPWWDAVFPGISDLDDTPLEHLIDRFVPEETTTALGGLSGHGKSWVGLSMAKALATGQSWLGFFKVKQTPVLYLIPEVGDKSLLYRLKKLRMEKLPKKLFRTRTQTQGETFDLKSKEMMAAAKDRVVFLDTTICFVKGEENAANDNAKGLRKDVLHLLGVAKAIVILDHSPKEFEKQDYMTLENVLRGTGDKGAMLGAAHGLKYIDRDHKKGETPIQIECIKPRDFEPWEPMQIGLRPWIDDTGDIKLIAKPGEVQHLAKEQASQKTGPKGLSSELAQKAIQLKKDDESLSNEKIARRLNTEEVPVSKDQVQRAIKAWKDSQQSEKEDDPSQGVIEDLLKDAKPVNEDDPPF